MKYGDVVKISIVVPIYNTEMYLRECLDSVLKQNFIEYEIICINDGSTDGSLGILSEYQTRDARIKVITTENRGLSAARNTGVENAQGEYICYLDSDDMLAEDALSRIWKEIEKNKVDMLVYNAKLQYENQDMREKYNKDAYYTRCGEYETLSNGPDLLCAFLKNNEFIETAWLMVLRRQFLNENKIVFYEKILYEDTIYAINCYIKARFVRYINQYNYIYRVRENSIMTKPVTHHNLKSRLVCYDEILKTIYTENLSDKMQVVVQKYLTTFVDDIKHIARVLNEKSDLLYSLSEREKLHLYSMGISEETFDFSQLIYRLGFGKLIYDCNEIYIYGAGKVATDVYRYINKLGVETKVKGFVVTNADDRKEHMSLPLLSVDDLEQLKKDNANDIVVLIAVRKKYHREIINELKRRNINNYEIIDERMEYIINQDL